MQQTRASRAAEERILQGDIFRDVDYFERVTEAGGIIEVSRIVFPLAVVLTQDCDLAQDHTFRRSEPALPTQDKWLISVLMAPLYNAEHVYRGEHLSDLGIRSETISKNRSPGTFLRNNERPRYHYLVFPGDIPIVPSVIDFKHYFSVHVEYLRQIKPARFVCTLSALFREDVCQRFAAYLSRIGLPDPA